VLGDGKAQSGEAGEVLHTMLDAAGVDPDGLYKAGLVACPTPGGRDPRPEEIAACSARLHQLFYLLKPTVVLLLGALPLKHFIGIRGVTRHHGTLFEHRYMFRGREHRVMMVPTYHPTQLLRFKDRGRLREAIEVIRWTLRPKTHLHSSKEP